MDFDGDGRIDMLSGSWPGKLYFFRRQEDGEFAAPEVLKDRDGNEIKVGSAAHVFACDWNGDGVLDLLVGNIQGEVHLILNEGTMQEPAFGPSTKLKADNEEIQVPGGDAGPLVVDWDGDGKPDLLVGNGDGSVYFYRNVGTTEGPELAAHEVLVPAPERNTKPGTEPQRGTRAKIAVADWNGNGRLDLLLGDFSMEQIQERALTEEDKAAREEAQKRFEEALARYQEASERVGKAADQEAKEKGQQEFSEALKEAQAAHRELAKYRTTRRELHGYVWVFPRKPPERLAETVEP